MQIDHINIGAPMTLLEEVRRFYCDVLGLVEGYRPNFAGRGYWLYVQDKPLVHLSENPGRQPGQDSGCFDHIAFRSNGLERVLEKLQRANVAYTVKRVPDIDLTQVFLKDPSGIGVEINFAAES